MALFVMSSLGVSIGWAGDCVKCQNVGGKMVCVGGTNESKYCTTNSSSNSCTAYEGCVSGGTGQRVGRIEVYDLSQGSSSGIPAVASVTSPAISDVKDELADIMSTSAAYIRLRAAVFAVGPQAAWDTLGHAVVTLWTSDGWSVSSSVSGSDVSFRICGLAGSSSASAGSAVVPDNDVLFAPVSMNGSDYIVAIQREDFSDVEWANNGVTVQSDFADDVENELYSGLTLSVWSDPPACEE